MRLTVELKPDGAYVILGIPLDHRFGMDARAAVDYLYNHAPGEYQKLKEHLSKASRFYTPPKKVELNDYD